MSASLGPLFEEVPLERRFDGETYDPPADGVRLTRQLQAVRNALADGRWWTLESLAAAAGCSTQSASARVRDLRKAKFGAHHVARRRLDGGLWEYRLAASREGP